ncbi:XRE family transcriptional regulator [Lysinibacillus mangiferihumi]|uniref:XRE family transcriptional regulator n=1 Tax=Lysinibacillus mangiferihumi TaxID=1130819 RepID=A0A4U2YJ09_9BACI|nr:S24 family peptidase [Lysinibacillus mangiferihumi]TKI59641.1 XRE family transcriptional regulator [Lysinibacillus mangiferihumi]
MQRGEKLTNFMRERGFNVSSISRQSGVPYTTVRSMIENNLVNSSIDNVIKLCRTLGITVENLLEEDTTELKEGNDYTYRFLPTVKISAGLPIDVECVDEIETITIPDELLGKYAGCEDIFFMRVNGESMNKTIPHDSLIAVKSCSVGDLKNGDIVVYSNGYDYSVKFFYESDDKFIFRPNSSDPIFTDHTLEKVNEDLRLHGKVVTYIVNLD